MEEQPGTSTRGSGDPLAAMYFVAAALMGLAALVVVLFLFLPRDMFSRSDPADVWVPGTGTSYEDTGSAPRVETAAEAAAREEQHAH